MKTLTLISCTLGIGMALSACGTDPIVLGELIAAAENGSGDEGATETPVEDPAATEDPTPVEDPAAVPDDPTESDAPVPYPTATSDEEAAVEQILLQYCGECHEAPANAGDLSVIADVDALIALALIIPGNKEDSAVYARMANGTMPPVSYPYQPTSEDIEAIGSFIDALE